MTNYKSMVERIKKCKTNKELYFVSKSLNRLFDVGTFSVAQFKNLDSVIVDSHIKQNLTPWVEY